ncbi:MAG: 16S rRNA (cytosine(1402)-N(4))-methyltransferase RsmH [Candidatus Portiera sp.]|nr:16S rRNA (cytosine(1402)-N(4))-methyltransferase RsmH [Portiera sp.]
MQESAKHIPIMTDQVVEQLITESNGFYIDATFGQGGHTRALLENTDKDALILGIDRDSTAITRGRCLFATEQRLILRHGHFSALADIAQEFQREVNGILMDIGISSDQLDDAERGFSFSQNGPLDMRMDQESGMPLSEWLASASAADIAKVIKDFGEEPYADRIAAAIVDYRKSNSIVTTKQLSALIVNSQPRRPLNKSHAATRSFQSLRIFINNEMEELRQGLNAAAGLLKNGGRLAVITFHSLEGRQVKDMKFGMKAVYKSKPDRSEILSNNRARSAVLRIMEKIN